MTIAPEMNATEKITPEMIAEAGFVDVTNLPSSDNRGNPGIVKAKPEQYRCWDLRSDGRIVVVTETGRVLVAKDAREIEEKFRLQWKVVYLLTTLSVRGLAIPLESLNPKHLAERRKDPLCIVS